jgi:hypothetical protein
MDFVRLGPAYSTAYIPDLLIEGYNSLVWHERHVDLGEFELKSFDVDAMMQALPEDTLVSHLETQEVMQVMTHTINSVGEGDDARDEITVKGKSATDILAHRWVEAPYGKKRYMRQKYSATSAACVLLWQAVDNNSGYDVTRGDAVAGGDPGNNYAWSVLDDIPNVIVTENVAAEGWVGGRLLEQGMLLPQLQPLLASQDLGLRCLRPILPNSMTVISVDSALATRGTIRRTLTNNVSALCFEIYDGIDRSASVQFSQLQGHIASPEYVISSENLKSHVEMKSDVVEVSDVYRPGDSGLSGWRRRTMEFEAGSPEIPEEPVQPKRPKANATKAQKQAYAQAYDTWYDKHATWVTKKNAIIADFRADSSAAALAKMKLESSRVKVVSGDISDVSPYKYKVHYGLGDYVTLVGDYGISSKMLVKEYIRTEDADGDRGYPGLVVPT